MRKAGLWGNLFFVFSGLLGSLFFAPARSYAFSITPLMGVTLSSGFMDANNGYSADFGNFKYGYGLVMEFSMAKMMALEIGGIYMPREFQKKFTTNTTTVTMNTLQIPILIRYYVLPGVSFALGGFFSHGVGTVAESDSRPAATRTVNYNALSYAADDYGIEASVGLRVAMSKTFGIVMQARVLYGMADVIQTPNQSGTLYDFQGFAGIKFGP